MVNVPEEIAARKAREKLALDLAKSALDSGFNHALTLSPDVYWCANDETAAGFINGLCKRTIRKMNRDIKGMSRSEAERSVGFDVHGVYETRNKRKLVYPHAHLVLRIGDDELMETRVFLENHWGAKTEDDSSYYPPCLPIDRRLGKGAHAWLEGIYDMLGWTKYFCKALDSDLTELDVYSRQFFRLDALRAA